MNVILNIVLVPHLGILGAGLASLLAYTVLGIFTLIITERYLKFSLSFFFILKSLISSAVMAGVIWLIRPNSLSTVIISMVAGVIIYFGALALMKGFG